MIGLVTAMLLMLPGPYGLSSFTHGCGLRHSHHLGLSYALPFIEYPEAPVYKKPSSDSRPVRSQIHAPHLHRYSPQRSSASHRQVDSVNIPWRLLKIRVDNGHLIILYLRQILLISS